jgi:hypothetical protein
LFVTNVLKPDQACPVPGKSRRRTEQRAFSQKSLAIASLYRSPSYQSATN